MKTILMLICCVTMAMGSDSTVSRIYNHNAIVSQKTMTFDSCKLVKLINEPEYIEADSAYVIDNKCLFNHISLESLEHVKFRED